MLSSDAPYDVASNKRQAPSNALETLVVRVTRHPMMWRAMYARPCREHLAEAVLHRHLAGIVNLDGVHLRGATANSGRGRGDNTDKFAVWRVQRRAGRRNRTIGF